MAVNTVQVSTVYEKLIGLATKTTNSQYDAGRLVGTDYAEAVNAAIAAAMQLAVSSVQGQPIKDGQVLDSKVKSFVALANAQKDIEIADMEIQLMAAQVATEDARQASMANADSINSANSTADSALKAQQKILIGAQKATELAKPALLTAQKDAYNDVKIVARVEAYGDAAGMYAAGGAIAEGLENSLYSAVQSALAS